MNLQHPLIKYGWAVMNVVHYDGQLEGMPQVDKLIDELNEGLIHFRIRPEEDIYSKEEVRFGYINQQKADGANFIYLSPHIIVEDKPSGNTYSSIVKVIEGLKKNPDGKTNVTMSIAPMAGDYLVFGPTNASKGSGSVTFKEAALSLIATTTMRKPALAYKTLDTKSKMIKRNNVAILPDMDLNDLVTFVRMMKVVSGAGERDPLKGVVYVEKDKNGKETKRRPMRPRIYDGNFPDAPSSSALSKVGLLASLGAIIREAEFKRKNPAWRSYQQLIERFPDTAFYMFGYGKAETFTYDHHVVQLSLEGNLASIVNAVYRSRLYLYANRKDSREEYAKFDLSAGRFLQLFTPGAWLDFFAFRAEYHSEILPLLNTFFMKKQGIDPVLVGAAKSLGAWVNMCAYIIANADKESNDSIYERKTKVLASFESSLMSAYSGSDFILRAVRDMSQHSKRDAPTDSSPFTEAVASGEIDLRNAKNLLAAFSRVSTKPSKDTSTDKEVLDIESSGDLFDREE